MAAILVQNGAYQGAMQAALAGRNLEGLSAAGDYTVTVAAANAFALQVSATITAANVTTADQQALLANICAAALIGRSLVAAGAVPNTYLNLSIAIAEAYALAKVNLTS